MTLYPPGSLAKVKTPRDPAHLKWVRTLPSVVSGRHGCVAHHLIGKGHGATGMTASSDYHTFPLTTEEHGLLHHDIAAWEQLHGDQWEHVARTLASRIWGGMK